ncbi:MAG: RHS repeat-associated core domain-containing protein [Gemmatimonadaceae bacterium]|nr:RHS repeat-associated core domain-containing protein [Gemmatimonadaceae bacterium]
MTPNTTLKSDVAAYDTRAGVGWRGRGCHTRFARLFVLASVALSVIATAPRQAAAQIFSVNPDGQALGKATSIALDSVGFGLVNLVSGQGYFREIACSGEVVNCGSNTPQGFTATAAQMTLYVTYQTTNTGGPGRIWLKVYKAGMTPMDTGWYNVTVTPTDLVSDLSANNNSNQDVGLCEASCFTPIYSQGTVPYYSLGAARNITLVYHGDRAAPAAMLYTNASIATTKTVSEYQLQATRTTGTTTPAIKFSNGDSVLRFAGTNAGQVRLGGRFDPDANSMTGTAMNPISVLLTAKFSDGTTQRQRFSPQVMMVDERKSPIARGWTIAGLQHLYKQADGNVLITDGSGSAAYFVASPSCSTCFSNSGGDVSSLTKGTSTWTRAYLDSTKAVFDTTGKLTSITDRFGNQTVFAYDASGRLTEVQDPILTWSGGRKAIVLTYGTYGLASVQNPSTAVNARSGGRITYFTVSADSTLHAIKDPDGDSTVFGYSNKLLQTVTDRRGGVTTYTLDANGRLQYVTLPQVQLYNGMASPRRQYVDSRMSGVPTTSTVTTPWPSTLSSALADTVRDELGNRTSFSVNPWGQPLSIAEPYGRTTTISRSGIYPTVVQYPEGGIDSTTFSSGLLTSQRLAGENRVNLRYGGWGQPDSVGGTGWPSLRASLGAGGRVDWTRVGPADSLRMSYTYDSRGRVLTATDSMAHVTRFSYDAVTGNLDSTVAPGNRFTHRTYDAYGRLSTQQSNNEPARQIAYDSVDRVIATYDSVGATPTRYSYDDLYLTRVQDAKGQVYRFAPNALGWIDKRYDPADTLNRYDLYTYDSAGNVHSQTNRRGQQITFTYDSLHRLTSKSGTNTTSDYYEYSSDGRKIVARNAVSADSIYLATSGAVDSAVTVINGQRFRVGYRRNNINQVDSVGITGAGITFATRRYGWNRETGELDTMTVNGYQTVFVHNKDLLPWKTIWPSVTRTEQWTSIHRPSEQSFSSGAIDTAFFRRYSYDSRFGMQDYEKREGSNFRTRQRAYDWMRRVGGLGNNLYAGSSCPQDTNNGFVCPVTLQSTVTYDAVGNRTDASNALYATGNRLLRFNADSFAYDLDGNDTLRVTLSSGVRKSYEWSAEGRLTRVLIGGVEKVRFDYNAQGQLVRRSTNGSVDRYYLWAGDELLAELDANAAHRVSEYAYLPGVDQPFALITGATTIDSVRYDVLDEAGNVIGVTNGTAVSQATTYDDWGVATTTGSTDNRLLFKGLLWEPDAGLYYVRARWYDPTTGRFPSEDPIGLAGGINQYAFAHDDPTNLSDPSGRCLICIGALIGAAVNVVIHGVRNTHHHKPFFAGAGKAALTGAAVGAGVGAIVQFGPEIASAVLPAGRSLAQSYLQSQWRNPFLRRFGLFSLRTNKERENPVTGACPAAFRVSERGYFNLLPAVFTWALQVNRLPTGPNEHVGNPDFFYGTVDVQADGRYRYNVKGWLDCGEGSVWGIFAGSLANG